MQHPCEYIYILEIIDICLEQFAYISLGGFKVPVAVFNGTKKWIERTDDAEFGIIEILLNRITERMVPTFGLYRVARESAALTSASL